MYVATSAAIRANYCRNSLERTAISLTNYKYQSPVHLFPGRLRPARWIDAGLIEQSDDISLEALEGGLGDSLMCSGSLSAILDLEPETGADGDYGKLA